MPEHDIYIDYTSENDPEIALKQAYKKLGIKDVTEPHLYFSPNKGWKHEAVYNVVEPDSDIADTLLADNDYDGNIEVYHNEKEPCLHVALSSHDVPFGEYYTVIPASWAREAYTSKEFHDHISHLMENDEVKEFLYDAKAIPELEKDPMTFGIVMGFINNSYSLYSNSYINLPEMADFDMKEFKEFCHEQERYFSSDREMTFEEALEWKSKDPYDVAYIVEEAFGDYLCKSKANKNELMEKGIQAVLNKPFDEILETLGEFVNHPKAVMPKIKKLGSAQIAHEGGRE